MRWMGLDYGSKTVGVALSDELKLTAQPYETIYRTSENKLRKTLARLVQLTLEKSVEKIILGRPLHLDGTGGERVRKCEDFALLLEKRTGIKPIWQDERLTSVAADEILAQSGIKREDRKKYIDSVAASLILEDYMKSHARE